MDSGIKGAGIQNSQSLKFTVKKLISQQEFLYLINLHRWELGHLQNSMGCRPLRQSFLHCITVNKEFYDLILVKIILWQPSFIPMTVPTFYSLNVERELVWLLPLCRSDEEGMFMDNGGENGKLYTKGDLFLFIIIKGALPMDVWQQNFLMADQHVMACLHRFTALLIVQQNMLVLIPLQL